MRYTYTNRSDISYTYGLTGFNETKALPVGNFGMPNVNSELIKNISNSRALLCALKPYLDKERCERIDKILGMMKIAEIMGYIK